MKKLIYLAIIILGVCLILGGCAGSGNNSKIPSKYKWIYGEWSSGTASFTIQEPNQIFIDDSYYGWLKFGIEDNKLHAYLAQDWLEFTLDSSNETIMDETGEMYMKGGKASSSNNKASQDSDKFKVVGEWVCRHGKSGDLNLSQEYEEGVRFNSDMTGVYNSFIATYRGLDRTNRKRTGSFTFTWDIVGNDVYITLDGERSHAFTYSMYGTLTDSGGNVFKRQ